MSGIGSGGLLDMTLRAKKVNLGSKGSFTEHPGRLHRALGIPLDKNLTAADLARGAHSPDPKVRRETASAKGFRAMVKK